MCGWRDSQEILPRINVFGLAAPHAGCLEDSDKWLDNKTWNGGRQILSSYCSTRCACVCVCLCGGLPCLSSPSPQSMACPRFIHINFGHTNLGQIQYIKIQSLTLFSMYNQEIIELTNKHDKSRPVGFNGQISLSFCLLMQTSKNLINCISSPT